MFIRFSRLQLAGLMSIACLLPLLTVCAHGQETPGAGDNSYDAPSAESPLSQTYSTSLATGEAIPLSGQSSGAQPESEVEGGARFLYGGSVSAAYMQDYSSSTSIDHIVTGVLNPYFGVYIPTRTGGASLQYQGTFVPDDAFSNDFQTYHLLSFTAVDALNRRWFWGLSSTASYGSAAAQFEGPVAYMSAGLVPVVDPVQPDAFFVGRTEALAENSAELGWKRTDRSTISLTASHFYSDISAGSAGTGLPANQSNALGGKLDYYRDVTERFKFNLYAQEEHVMKSDCDMYGGGAGIGAQLSSTWHLDLSGGPEWSSTSCGKQTSYNVYGALVKTLRGQAQIYAVGWEYYNLAFQTTNTWQDAAAVGFVQPIAARFSVEGTAGYFRGNPLFVTTEPLEGYFVAPLTRYKLTENLAVSGGYRMFHPTSGNTVPGNLNFAVFSLEWHPRSFQFGR